VRRGNETVAGGGGGDDDAPRDQGFARAKVLLLLPLRSLAHAAVLRLAALLQRETRADSVQGKARFEAEYGPGSDDDDDEASRHAHRRHPPPADHAALFGGNADDHFRCGLRVTRGAVKIFADFESADVIIASPLGLATYLEAGGPPAADALAGIELVVFDRADVAARQNWAHARAAFAALNRLPTATPPSLDIMRVRESALAGWARATRQVVVTTAYVTPAVGALFASAARSHAGRARLDLPPGGVLAAAPPLVQLAFERVPGDAAADPRAGADARFAHFTATVWPRLAAAGPAPGLLLFIPSYYDYVRLKKFFKDAAVPVADMGEYVPPRDAARARTRFAAGAPRLALLTERSHFYHRAVVRGMAHALFYAPPDDARFYAEVVAWVGARGRAVGDAPAGGRATALFSPLDALALERVVGRERAKRMVKGKEAAYVFC
jgi:U3 small nucleolar RNA-associated protein 25